MTARAFQRPDDLRLLLELEQELWRTSPDDVVCTFGQIAFWSAQLLHDDWAGRLWFDGEQLAGWGWLTGGTELELQVRPSHRDVVDEILDWASPTEVLVDERNADLVERLNARGLVHLPDAFWMRRHSPPGRSSASEGKISSFARSYTTMSAGACSRMAPRSLKPPKWAGR